MEQTYTVVWPQCSRQWSYEFQYVKLCRVRIQISPLFGKKQLAAELSISEQKIVISK